MKTSQSLDGSFTYTRRNIIIYFIGYSILFAVICYFVLSPFIQEDKSLIWKIDGIPQYMLWLQYSGKYLRGLIKEMADGILTIPMYDFNIGMGNDIRMFFKMDPFQFAGILLIFGTRGTVHLYNWLSVLRIYLIGVSFSCYGFYMKKNYLPILAGAITYTFSSYTFYQIERHPQFVISAIMLPLLLIGIEQIIYKKGILFYSLIVSLALVTSYYFLYMSTILMGLYFLLRLKAVYPEHTISEFFHLMPRIIGGYLFGAGMALVFFIPAIANYFLSSRSSKGTSSHKAIGSLLTFRIEKLRDVFLSIIGPTYRGNYTMAICVGILIVPALIILFISKNRDRRPLQAGFILGVLFLVFPVFGYIFSGFSAVNNRWAYGFVFLMSVIVMTVFEDIQTMTRIQYLVLLAVIILYFIYRYVMAEEYRLDINTLVILTAALVLIGFIRILPVFHGRNAQAAFLILMCISVASNGYLFNSLDWGNMVSQFQNEETASNYFSTSRYKLLKNIQDDSFYRIDTDMMYHNYNNASVALGYNGISLYSSTIRSNVLSYFTESESVGISALNRIMFLDNRSFQEALACVKYFITFKDTSRCVPYGFVKDKELSDNSAEYDIYINQNTLPIGYNYDKIMRCSQYEKIPAVNKQKIQMDTAVINDEDINDFTGISEVSDTNLPLDTGQFEITGIDQGITRQGNTFSLPKEKKVDWVPESNSDTDHVSPKIHFSTLSKENCEVYLRLKGVHYSLKNRTDVIVHTNEIKKRAIVRSTSDTYGLNVSNYLINLGYYDRAEKLEGDISFSSPGDYTIDDFEVYYLSMEDYPNYINDLKNHGLEQITCSTNTISGKTSSEKDHILSFSIPNHVGWSAYIDGNKTKLYNINTLYTGIIVPAGTHDICLTYHSPGIFIGLAISVTCWTIYLTLYIIYIQRKKGNQ